MGNYSRYVYRLEEATMLPLVYKGEESHRWLTFLLNEGAIFSWNVAEGTEKIFVKICAGDEAMDVATGRGWKWNEWKTLETASKP